MSAPKVTDKTYASQVWQKTETPGVYRRGRSYIAMTRPDGRRKTIHRFATYEEAVAFKATTPSNRRRRSLDYVSKESTAHLRGDPCAYCGGLGQVIDHIVPRSANGTHHWSNLTMACSSCNSRKYDKPLLIFLAHEHGCWEWRPAVQ